MLLQIGDFNDQPRIGIWTPRIGALILAIQDFHFRLCLFSRDTGTQARNRSQKSCASLHLLRRYEIHFVNTRRPNIDPRAQVRKSEIRRQHTDHSVIAGVESDILADDIV